MKTLTTEQIKETLFKNGIHPDMISRKQDGTFIFRRGFFYTNGQSAEDYAERISNALNIEIIEYRDIWKPFRGGASLAAQSHFYVNFKLK